MSTYTIQKTLEELGNDCVNLKVDVVVTEYPEWRCPVDPLEGRRMMPDEPAYFEPEEFEVQSITGDNYQWERSEREDWFALLDLIAERELEDDLFE